MPKLTLDLNTLSVDTFATADAMARVDGDATVTGCSVACPTRFC